MKKYSGYFVCFVAGIFFTFIVVYLFGKCDIDILSMKKEQPVVTKRDLIFVDENGKEISLPSGTSLMLKSQYRDEGTFFLEVVSSNLVDFERTEKRQIYFQKIN